MRNIFTRQPSLDLTYVCDQNDCLHCKYKKTIDFSSSTHVHVQRGPIMIQFSNGCTQVLLRALKGMKNTLTLLSLRRSTILRLKVALKDSSVGICKLTMLGNDLTLWSYIIKEVCDVSDLVWILATLNSRDKRRHFSP